MIGTMTSSRTAKRRVFALMLAVAVMLLPVAAPLANAEPDYPPSFDGISASRYTAHICGRISFKAQTFLPGSTVTWDASTASGTYKSGTVTANGSGKAHTTIKFNVAGTYVVTFSGTSDEGNPLTLSTTVKISGGKCKNSARITTGSGSGAGNDDTTAVAAEELSSGVPFLGGGLPRTGGDIALTVLIGVALLGGGTALVVAATRRRRTQ